MLELIHSWAHLFFIVIINVYAIGNVVLLVGFVRDHDDYILTGIQQHLEFILIGVAIFLFGSIIWIIKHVDNKIGKDD